MASADISLKCSVGEGVGEGREYCREMEHNFPKAADNFLSMFKLCML